MTDPIRVRRFREGDEPALFEIFHSAVHQIARRDYTPRQIEAWAPRTLDENAWREHIRVLQPFVAVRYGRPVGYADLQRNGYIDHFFVGGDHPRQGIGHALMAAIETQARHWQLGELSADVSLTAEAFFSRYGFQVVERQSRTVRGVALANARMHRVLRS
ncbi:acetyltransferase [Salinisphaera shabanensis T35B1]|uniref:GNAT family N-acetyltransferase n=1 Tax=Salinisphaera shabanensis TaxID=180542 RepID=UPI00334115DA